MSTSTMSVEAFVLAVTQCSGRIQRIVSDDGAVDASSIMEQLATREVYVTNADRLGRDFNIQRLGVELDGTLRIEVSPRWNLTRILICVMAALAGFALVGFGIALGSAL